jgi:hypothetical protein
MRDDGPVVTLDDVRRVALSLPATVEKPSYGTPGFRVKDKLFARVREEGDVLVVWCWDTDEKAALIESDPDTYFTLPHYDGHPAVLVRFDAVDVEQLTDILTEAWRVRAPTRLRQSFDGST